MSDLHKPLTQVLTGERAGSATAVILPTLNCTMVWIKAVASNAGNVYIGSSTSATVVDGTTDTTSGYELTPGDQLGPLPLDNLNKLFIICDNAGDDITYICMA